MNRMCFVDIAETGSKPREASTCTEGWPSVPAGRGDTAWTQRGLILNYMS